MQIISLSEKICNLPVLAIMFVFLADFRLKIIKSRNKDIFSCLKNV